MTNHYYYIKQYTTSPRRINSLDMELSPNLQNSPYLIPPQKISPPKPPNQTKQKTFNDNIHHKKSNQLIHSYNHYSESKYHQLFQPCPTATEKKAQKGNHLSLWLNTTTSRFDLCSDKKYAEQRKSSPYSESQAKARFLAQRRAELRMRELKEKERRERERANREAAEAIRLEKENEKEKSDLLFAKHDSGIRIIPTFDRANMETRK